jgi:SPP1 gp7 family putative phage head morphogenesis protein
MAAMDPRERALRGIVGRNGYERWLARETVRVLERGFADLATTLLTKYRDLEARDRARLLALFGDVNRHLKAAYGTAAATTQRELEAYGALEADAARAEAAGLLEAAGGEHGLIANALGGSLTRATVRAVAELPIQGKNLGEWWESQARNMSEATRGSLQQGLLLGEPTTKLVARLLPERGSVTPAAFARARREATMLVRTATSAVQNAAAMSTYEALGEDVSAWYELVTARDARVSKICAALDGRRFRYDDPKRMEPPFHINCRTTTAPVINYKDLGLPEPPAAKVGGRALPTLAKWLREQPERTQAAVLGPTRARWFRGGRMTLPDLIADDTRVLTLPELRAKLGLKAPSGSDRRAGARV